MSKIKKLFLIDAFAIIYRAYFAFSKNPRINSKGLETSAVLGFVNTLLEVLKKVPGYSTEMFLKRIPRLINEPYTKEMGIKIAKKVTEKGMVRLVKIAAGSNI